MENKGVSRESAKRCVGKGWNSLIDEFYDKYPDVTMVQVKEKYGTLCLYHDNGTYGSGVDEGIIREKSSTMCEECGEKAETKEVRGWFWTLCDYHIKEKIEKHGCTKDS